MTMKSERWMRTRSDAGDGHGDAEWTDAWPALRRIAQVMQPRLVLARRDEPLASAMAALHTERARYAVVMNGPDSHSDFIEGVLAVRDLDALTWMVRGRSAAWMTELAVEDVMRTPPLLLAPDASLAHAGRLLREGTRDCVVVVSEGRPVGVVTRDELLGTVAMSADGHRH
jgi:CBS domain-containing protein